MKKKSKAIEYLLHFIGKSYYTQASFESEAKRYGIQRALPYTFLKQLHFGDQILLASYSTTPKIEEVPETDKVEKEGVAEVFGYLTITGISHNLPLETTQKLYEKLDIVQIDNNYHNVTRACGSYTVGAVATIRDSLPDLLKKIEDLFRTHDTKEIEPTQGRYCSCSKCNTKENPHNALQCLNSCCLCCTKVEYDVLNKYKWFISGNFNALTSFVVQPIKFARGLITVKLKNLNLEHQQHETANLIWLYDYKLREYMPINMKERFGASERFGEMFT